MKVKWNGISYNSVEEAAKALGITPAGVYHRLKQGHTCDDDLLQVHPFQGKKIEWDNVIYSSLKEASEATGIAYTTLTQWVQKGFKSLDGVENSKIDRKKRSVKVTLSTEMMALLQTRYGDVSADTVRQAIADLFAIENNVQHGGSRKGAGRPALYDLECQECGHQWRETLPTLGCPECDSEEFWTYENNA